MSVLRLVSVVGARPQFVKLAPIVRVAGQRGDVDHRILHTGQHYDSAMSDVFFEDLKMPAPDADLGIGSGSHGEQTAAMLVALEKTFSGERPDAVLVYGDTNSTLAATLAATKIHVPVAHIEAGLRSFNRKMPEEINRLVADHCSDRLYAPTPVAVANLEDENLGERTVRSGDVMRDAVNFNIEQARRSSTILDDLALEQAAFSLVTVHRPANTDGANLELLLDRLEESSRRHLPMVFPVHPRTRAMLEKMGYQPPPTLRLTEPMPYLDNLQLLDNARYVVTDSGGVQKEAAFLETPCFTARNETEWTETLDIGVNRIVHDGASGLLAAIEEFMVSPVEFGADVHRQIDESYGRGDAANRIVDDCVEWLS